MDQFIDHSSKIKETDYEDPQLDEKIKLTDFWKSMQVGKKTRKLIVE